ncbi:MAG: hypothetical protein V3S22_04625 [Candidatus Neomarinimicrobiota bacterium]
MNTMIKLFLVTVFLLAGCSDDKDCPDCGSILEGYIFKSITTSDLAQNEGLALLEGVNAGVCVRAKLSGQEFDLDTVEVVDDCCCAD